MAKKNQVDAVEPAPNQWKTLHVFGFGKTQLINEMQLGKLRKAERNLVDDKLPKFMDDRVETSTLTKAQALIDFVYSKKPADSDAGVEYHAITIVKNVHCLYVPKNVDEEHFRILYKDMDATLIEDLVSELQAI